jgi:AcrR family transcriptional regulator
MSRRAELVEQTRQRITEAAVRLHTSIGPSETSMSSVADEAGVTRLTLYRHFPSKDELFGACMTHWRSLHPPPDPERWRAIPSLEARVRRGLIELYRWYAANGDDLYPIYRDAAFTPASNRRARQANNERMGDAMLGDADVGDNARRLRAAVGHVIGFWTWRSLVVDQGLSTAAASAMAAEFVLAARRRVVPTGRSASRSR